MIVLKYECGLCHSQKCDGREYHVVGTYDYYGHHTVDKIVCSSMLNKEGKYEVICGHGGSFIFDAKPKTNDTTAPAVMLRPNGQPSAPGRKRTCFVERRVMRTPDMFGGKPKQPRRILAHVADCGSGMIRFECKCGWDSDWLEMDMTVSEAKKGIPCPQCNKGAEHARNTKT